MPAYRNVRVLVLGASGFIGRWVARYLYQEQADLYLAVRDAGSLPGGAFRGGQVRELDLLDDGALQALVRETAPDTVFNLAGYGINPAERDPALAEAINAAFLPRLVEAISRLPATRWQGNRIVHTGSALEYGVCSGALAETTEARPTTLYGRTKLAGTLALQQAALADEMPAVTARLFTVYGPGERAGRLLPALLAAARSGESLELTAGTQQRDFTYVEDIAAGLLELGKAVTAPGEVVNLASGRLTSVRAFTEISAGVLGIPAGKLHFGALPTRQEEMQHAPVATGKLQKLLGWLPTTTIQEGVERTLQHERSAEAGVDMM
jgi:nucleoside-diphosphate-sugar epimerase